MQTGPGAVDARSGVSHAERELRAVTDHIDKLTRLLTQTDKPEPLLRTIETMEREREDLAEHTAQLQVETEREKQLRRHHRSQRQANAANARP